MTTPGGAVFDLDGTVLDNIPFHMAAFATFVERHGLPPLDEEKRARIDGKRNRDVFPIVFDRELSDEEVMRFADEKERLYRELSRGRLVPRRGLLPLLFELLLLAYVVLGPAYYPTEISWLYDRKYFLPQSGIAVALALLAIMPP